MSAKFTHLVWQLHTQTPVEKLVLLMLADIADHQGTVLLDIEQSAPLCSLSSYALADCLTNLAQQGWINKERLERRQGREIHIFRITLSVSRELPVIHQTAEPVRRTEVAPEPIKTEPKNDLPGNIPEWAKKELSFNGINSQLQQQIWDSFKQSIDFSQLSCTPLARLERYLQNWLQTQTNTQADSFRPQTTQGSHLSRPDNFTKPAPIHQNSRQEFVSTHDLDEYQIPVWAEKAFKFSAVTTNHALIWQKFVLWHKSKANELLAVSKLENKLKYWLANEKLNEDRKTRTQGYSGTSEQAKGDGHRRKLSPSERFRQQLIQQGKKPTF